jgi:glutaredoxin
MAYYLQVNSLIGCPYSIELENIIQTKRIHAEINKVSSDEKHLYKNDEISTFPQVYLKKYNSQGSILLGGNSDIKEILGNNNKTFDEQFKFITKKYPKMSKKAKLRVIELFLKK